MVSVRPPKSILLKGGTDADLRLGFYPPGCAQREHSHDIPTISLVLAGSVLEGVGTKETFGHTSWLSMKPPAVRHRDEFGRDGAIILSVAIRNPKLWEATVSRPEWRWQPIDADVYREMVGLLKTDDAAVASADLAFDILALASEPEWKCGVAPAWLRLMKQRLEEDPTTPIAQMATDAGVHRVYLARAFRRWYGVSPASFRLQSKTSAALRGALFYGVTPAKAALDAGFADQSHMARAIRGATGNSLSSLRGFAVA